MDYAKSNVTTFRKLPPCPYGLPCLKFRREGQREEEDKGEVEIEIEMELPRKKEGEEEEVEEEA